MCDKQASVCKYLKLKTRHFIEVVSPVDIPKVVLFMGRLFCEPVSPSLEPRAASREPWASVCEPQKIPAKKSKNWHNALIWHLLHAKYFIYANTRGTFYQTAPSKGNRTLTILIPFPNSLHKRSRAVNRFVKNGKANFGSPIECNSRYSGQKNLKWIFHLTLTKISGIFGIMKTPAVFMSWCTVAWQVRLWKFFLSFFISSN